MVINLCCLSAGMFGCWEKIHFNQGLRSCVCVCVCLRICRFAEGVCVCVFTACVRLVECVRATVCVCFPRRVPSLGSRCL